MESDETRDYTAQFGGGQANGERGAQEDRRAESRSGATHTQK